MGARRPLFCAAALALWAWACSVEPVDIEGKECPCAAGYTCDPRTKRCIIGNATGGSAGAASGGAAGSGSGGVAGSAGSAPSGGGSGGLGADASVEETSSGGSSSGGTSSDGGGTGGTVASGGGSSGTGGATGNKGSCVGHCDLDDEPVPGSKPPCYCDAACEGYGDCCSDKIQVCGKAPADAGAG